METVGLIEKVELIGEKGKVEVAAVCDTGARMTSIDTNLAKSIGIDPVTKAIGTTKVKNPSVPTEFERKVVEIELILKGKKFKCHANLQDRSHMTCKMLIGRNVLFKNFIVDVSKSHYDYELKSVKDPKLKLLLKRTPNK